MQEVLSYNEGEPLLLWKKALCGMEKSVMWNREESYVDNKT